MARVCTCPKNMTEVEVAATRMKCGVDEHGNSQYMCVPNVETTSLVEFCYNDTLGIRNKGECLVTTGENLTTTSCVHFSSGCPDDFFWDYDFFKYPACQQIDQHHQCYLSDPRCALKDEENLNYVLYSLIAACIFVVVIASFILVLYIKERKGKERKKPMLGQDEEEKDNLLREKEEIEKQLCQEKEKVEKLLRQEVERLRQEEEKAEKLLREKEEMEKQSSFLIGQEVERLRQEKEKAEKLLCEKEEKEKQSCQEVERLRKY